MPIPQRIAVSLPANASVEASLAQAEWAEQAGFDDVWFADGGTVDALTLAAAVAVRTRRVRIGTAIIPVYTRTPAVLAATASTLSHLAPERFILGLGASSHAMIENWHGLKLEKPLTRVKETAQIVRGLLAGEKSDFAGETLRSRGYRVNPLPAGTVPVYLAALRSRMLEMAGEVGDGVVVNLFPYEALGQMLAHVEAGARRAGQGLAQREIVCRHQVWVTDDKPGARAVFRKHFAPYYATPVYNRFLAWCGYEGVADTIEEGWRQRDRDKTTGALSDALIDRIAVIGTAEECRERIRTLARGGITTHIIGTLAPDEEGQRRTLEAFAPGSFALSG